MDTLSVNDNRDVIEFVALTAGSQDFCTEITYIREIRRWISVTPLPNAEESVLGVMNLRGAVIPIVDLGWRLGLEETVIGSRNVIVVVAIGARSIGLLVDAVSEILTVSRDSIKPNPTQRNEGAANEIVGLLSVDEKMLRVLDLDALFQKKSKDVA